LASFYGKVVVTDFILVMQVILLCVLTTGILPPGPEGMMLESFVFFCFTGIYSNGY